MIRLNDTDKTVIDEKEIKGYFAYDYKDDEYDTIIEYCLRIIRRHNTSMFQYGTKKARDKDIELLDKLFDVKSIEGVAKPELYSNEGGINEESKLVSEGEYNPVKKEEYLTWEEVKNSEKKINIKLSNGDIHRVSYDEANERIRFWVGDDYEGCIYEEDLFNALKLKRVE